MSSYTITITDVVPYVITITDVIDLSIEIE